MRPALPCSVQIGTVEYTVTDDPLDWVAIEHETKTTGYYGHAQHHHAIIYINPDMTDDVKRLTLLHEVLHAALEVMAGSPDWDDLDPKSQKNREETVVRTFESPILTILQQNPDLVAYLTS